MQWNKWVRQTHRWLSIAFTVTVIATFIALAQEKPLVWVSYVPLLPLALLFFTGAYLFVLPYATRWRGGRRTDGTAGWRPDWGAARAGLHELSNVRAAPRNPAATMTSESG